MSNPAPASALAVALLAAVATSPASAEEPCALATRSSAWSAPIVVAGGTITTLDAVVDAPETVRVVHVGESHDRFDHHLNQLEVICRLHARGLQVAIGLEMFQRPFQRHLDDFVAGRIDLDALLERSEYFDRWRYDARLYAPILEYARENGLPLVALNVDSALLRAVARGGLDGVEEQDRHRLPEMAGSQPGRYEARLRAVFDQHPSSPHRTFENFLASQVLWDETMAETAARFLEENPEHLMVVIAGNGHIAWRDGIPERLERRLDATGVVVVNETPGRDADPASGDFVLLSKPLSLEPSGLMGVFLEDGEEGLVVADVSEGGAAQAAGIVAGERIERVGGSPVRRFADVKARLWREPPGAAVAVDVVGTDGTRREVALTLR